ALTPATSGWHSDYASGALFGCAAIAALLVARCLRPREIWRKIRNRRIRTTLLAICVKGFFTPLMTGFVVGHVNSFTKAWLTHKHLASFDYKAPAGLNIFGQISLWWHQVGSRLGDLIPSGSDVSGFVSVSNWTQGDV